MVRTRTGLLQLLVIFAVDRTVKMNSLGQVIRTQVHGIYTRKSRDYANLFTRAVLSKFNKHALLLQVSTYSFNCSIYAYDRVRLSICLLLTGELSFSGTLGVMN